MRTLDIPCDPAYAPRTLTIYPSSPPGETVMPLARVSGLHFDALVDRSDGPRGRSCVWGLALLACLAWSARG